MFKQTAEAARTPCASKYLHRCDDLSRNGGVTSAGGWRSGLFCVWTCLSWFCESQWGGLTFQKPAPDPHSQSRRRKRTVWTLPTVNRRRSSSWRTSHASPLSQRPAGKSVAAEGTLRSGQGLTSTNMQKKCQTLKNKIIKPDAWAPGFFHLLHFKHICCFYSQMMLRGSPRRPHSGVSMQIYSNMGLSRAQFVMEREINSETLWSEDATLRSCHSQTNKETQIKSGSCFIFYLHPFICVLRQHLVTQGPLELK